MKAVMEIHSQDNIGSCPHGSRELRGQRGVETHQVGYPHRLLTLNMILRHTAYMLLFSPHKSKEKRCRVPMAKSQVLSMSTQRNGRKGTDEKTVVRPHIWAAGCGAGAPCKE